MANILPANSEIPFYIVINQSSPPPIPMFYMFEVQIPVDAYPVFGLKRHFFLFVIDARRSQAERLVIQFNCRIRTGWQSAHKKFF